MCMMVNTYLHPCYMTGRTSYPLTHCVCIDRSKFTDGAGSYSLNCFSYYFCPVDTYVHAMYAVHMSRLAHKTDH